MSSTSGAEDAQKWDRDVIKKSIPIALHRAGTQELRSGQKALEFPEPEPKKAWRSIP